MIAITGIGAVSPIGTGKEKIIKSLSASASGISGSGNFRSSWIKVCNFGEARDFVPKEHIPAMKARRMSRFSQLALASAVEAVRDSGIDISENNCFDIGIVVGTGLASTDSTDRFYEGLLREGPEGTNPMVFPETVQNIAASHIAMHFSTKGPNTTFSHSDISGDLAFFYGCELLQDRQADYVIICGADELSISSLTGYSSFGVVSDQMMPFDKNRNGFVLAEGAATLVLERFDDAIKRNAPVYCLISSTSFSSSPVSNIAYDSSLHSMKTSMGNALEKAGIDYPDFISASANSTGQLDMLEAEAISSCFKEKTSLIPVTAFRSYYGFFHGDSIFRIALAALCMKEGIIPKIIGLKEPSPEFRLDFVTGMTRNKKIDSALVNSFSIGGSAASTVLKGPA